MQKQVPRVLTAWVHLPSHSSFIARPHTEDFYRFFLLVYLINKPVLDIDPTRVCTRKIAHQLLIRGRVLKRVFGDYFQKRLRLLLEIWRSEFPGVFLCLPGKVDSPHYQSRSSLHSSRSASIPSRMDSLAYQEWIRDTAFRLWRSSLLRRAAQRYPSCPLR